MRVSYSIVNLSYPIVRVSYMYQVFRLSYRENCLSGFAFIVYQVLRLIGFVFIRFSVYSVIGIPRHFDEQINEILEISYMSGH